MGGVFNTVNASLYHYAGNNPIKYIDPDGNSAKNATKEYIVIRLESNNDKSHYMILAPGDFSKANCDGFIFSSSNIGKVSAKEEWEDVVNFTVLGDFDFCSFAYINDFKSLWTNISRDVLKMGFNALIVIKNIRHFFTDKKYEGECRVLRFI